MQLSIRTCFEIFLKKKSISALRDAIQPVCTDFAKIVSKFRELVTDNCLHSYPALLAQTNWLQS